MILLSTLSEREEIPIRTKFKEKPQGSHLVKHKNEIDYKYYICDYCGEEIKIAKKWQDRSGGIVILPNSLTNRGNIQVVAHNKCLNKLIKELENRKGE